MINIGSYSLSFTSPEDMIILKLITKREIGINDIRRNIMTILGLHTFSYDADVCLICDDNVCAIQQGRLTRIKYDDGIDLIVFDRLAPTGYKNNTIKELRN